MKKNALRFVWLSPLCDIATKQAILAACHEDFDRAFQCLLMTATLQSKAKQSAHFLRKLPF